MVLASRKRLRPSVALERRASDELSALVDGPRGAAADSGTERHDDEIAKMDGDFATRVARMDRDPLFDPVVVA